MLLAVVVATLVLAVGLRHFACRTPLSRTGAVSSPTAVNLLLVTIDTLRADHVGAYGYTAGTTPALDGIARQGVVFEHAYAAAPITLPSHASLLTGRYPPGHGARDNLMPVDARVPTLATILKKRGFQTAAFIAAFPLDRRFGLSSGFDLYSDRMPRGPAGKLLNERPGREVVDEALAWLSGRTSSPFFVWVHLFEPHAPYGDPAHDRRPALERYDDEIRTADAQVGRLLNGLGAALTQTVVIVAGDHGEAFGEHGEVGHSIFVYDTTLRVPWIVMGPGVPPQRAVDDRVCLIDVAPTALALLGQGAMDADGIDVRPAFDGRHLAARELYAESFAPLMDFGWSPLRSIRSRQWKAIEAPRPELYDIDHDPGELTDRSAADVEVRNALSARVSAYSSSALADQATRAARLDREAAGRLQALGYVQGAGAGPAAPGGRADPKDKRELAARMGRVVSGEVQGAELEAALRGVLRDDPGNPQAHLRLGDCLLDRRQWSEAAPHFRVAIAADLPSVDAYVGLAACLSAMGKVDEVERILLQARRREPGNPVVAANIGIVQASRGRDADAVGSFTEALAVDPDLHEVRFDLARAYGRLGRRSDAAREAQELLQRLPTDAPQRPEVERLLQAVRRP